MPAPLFRSSETTGKAIITGTNETAPTSEAKSMPIKPVSSPIKRLFVSGESTASANPTRSRIATNYGRTPVNIFHAFFKDNSAFLVFQKREKK